MTKEESALIANMRDNANRSRDNKRQFELRYLADTIERIANERDAALAPVAWQYTTSRGKKEIGEVHPVESGDDTGAKDILPIRDRDALQIILELCLYAERVEDDLADAKAWIAAQEVPQKSRMKGQTIQ